MKPLKNQRGMIDIVLIAVFAVLIAGLGGYIYYHQQQANKTYDAAGNGVTVTSKPKAASKATTTIPTGVNGYVTIGSWQVKGKTTPGITLQIMVNKFGDLDFSSKELVAVEPNCSSGQEPAGGTISRAPQKTKPDGTPYALQPGTRLIGGYVYIYLHNQDVCSRNSQNIPLEQATSAAVENFFATLQPL